MSTDSDGEAGDDGRILPADDAPIRRDLPPMTRSEVAGERPGRLFGAPQRLRERPGRLFGPSPVRAASGDRLIGKALVHGDIAGDKPERVLDAVGDEPRLLDRHTDRLTAVPPIVRPKITEGAPTTSGIAAPLETDAAALDERAALLESDPEAALGTPADVAADPRARLPRAEDALPTAGGPAEGVASQMTGRADGFMAERRATTSSDRPSAADGYLGSRRQGGTDDRLAEQVEGVAERAARATERLARPTTSNDASPEAAADAVASSSGSTDHEAPRQESPRQESPRPQAAATSSGSAAGGSAARTAGVAAGAAAAAGGLVGQVRTVLADLGMPSDALSQLSAELDEEARRGSGEQRLISLATTRAEALARERGAPPGVVERVRDELWRLVPSDGGPGQAPVGAATSRGDTSSRPFSSDSAWTPLASGGQQGQPGRAATPGAASRSGPSVGRWIVVGIAALIIVPNLIRGCVTALT